MSADNGIYIAKFPDGYRVTHAQAIENIDYYPIGTDEFRKTLKDYFSDSPVYGTKDEAILAAHKLEDKILADDSRPIIEYGVSYIGELPSFD